MGNSGGIVSESQMQDITCNSLLFRITSIKTVDQHVRINEEGHDRKGPLSSNRGLRVRLRSHASCGTPRFAFPGGPSPARKDRAVAAATPRPLDAMGTATALQRAGSPPPP